MKIYLSLIFLILSFPTDAHVEDSTVQNTEVLTTIASIIKEQFVTKSVAEKVATELMTTDFQEPFAHIQSREKFAEQLTDDLRKLSGDNHIGIVYSPEDVKRYRARASASSNPIARKVNEENNVAALRESRLANFGIQQVRILAGNIGFLEMRYFDGFVDESAPVFASAMDLLANSKAIILDLRRNGGGNSKILPLFLAYFLGPEPIHFATRVERWQHSSDELYTDAEVKGARHFNKPLYILTSSTTFSLAEHVIYHIKAFKKATVIGERTYGGGKAFDPVVVDSNFYLRIPRIEILNAKTNDIYTEGQGISPDVATTSEMALDKAYFLALQNLITNENDENTIEHYQWVKRIVAAQAFHENIDFSVPNMNGRHRFDKFEFEIREKALWMSFKNLPWVMLRNLGGGYFFDDRSIQRQFSFNYTHGKYSLLVSREWENVISIKESEF